MKETIKDPKLTYIEIRTVEDDPHCMRIITTGNRPYTEMLVDSILAYRTKFGEFPALDQVVSAVNRNIALEHESI